MAALLPLAAAVLALLCSACSGESEPPGSSAGAAGANVGAAGIGDAGIAPRVVPEGLTIVAKPGGCGELAMTGLTLQRGVHGVELLAALKNEGGAPACSPSFSIELRGEGELTLAAGVGGLLVRGFYELGDASGSVAACVAPGDVAMIAITDLPSELVLEDARELIYFCNFWELEGEPLAGIDITDVRALQRAEGTSFTGTLVNGFDLPLTAPAVAIFPLDSGGRPLAVALGEGESDVPAGGAWRFETGAVQSPGVGYAAYPRHGP